MLINSMGNKRQKRFTCAGAWVHTWVGRGWGLGDVAVSRAELLQEGGAVLDGPNLRRQAHAVDEAALVAVQPHHVPEVEGLVAGLLAAEGEVEEAARRVRGSLPVPGGRGSR